MKNDNPKIAANEINRYCYCPYQWYYKRYYGSRELNKRYKELGIEASDHLSNFEKGKRFHKNYYRGYLIKRFLQFTAAVILVVAVLFILWQVV